MRNIMTRRAIQLTFAAALLVTAGSCGDDDSNAATAEPDPTAALTADPAESAYCDVAVEWAIHEYTPFDDSDPVAFRAYWSEWTEFKENAVETAPDEIKEDWVLRADTENQVLVPILEKYDFDTAVMMEQAKIGRASCRERGWRR